MIITISLAELLLIGLHRHIFSGKQAPRLKQLLEQATKPPQFFTSSISFLVMKIYSRKKVWDGILVLSNIFSPIK
jgi:hypothetical protein